MKNNQWWKEAVIYEVYVDKFAQDFKGLISKLDYLQGLGINCIWLLPHYPSPMIDGGYDISDYMSIRPELGNLDDFRNFVSHAHQKGIRIIVDFVLNHVSTEHPWFKEASASPDNPKRNYFLWSKTGKELDLSYKPFVHMKGSNWTLSENTGEYYFSTFFKEQADLNWDNPEVFDEALKIIDFWAKLGVDGFRLDAIGHLIKREGTNCRHLPETHEVIKKLRQYMDKKWPGVIFLAEAGGSLKETAKYFGNNDECHMAFNFGLMAHIYLALKRNDLTLIEKLIKESSDIPDACQWATFISNHDEITFTPLESEEERKEVVEWLDPEGKYSFRGGRGVSMRLATVFNGDKEKIINVFKILFNAPGSPVIYYGSEIGMKNLEMSPAPADTRLYVRGNFDWTEADKQMKDSESLFNKIAHLIRERRG